MSKIKEITTGVKKVKNNLGVTADKDEFSEWFTQLMLKADLADYTEVSGCIVYKPGSYAIWEKVKEEVDKRFKKLGVSNTYFPLLIPEKFLNKEKEHVEGFSPEVAWVTETGSTKLNERLAVRPTSETIMYPSYSKWIRSWRDLPLRYNQWNNVVRWEFKHPVPFFRGREFLWNELHTVLASEQEAMAEGFSILNAYQEVDEQVLALYGLMGKKTEREKFAGGVSSYKHHYILQNGRIVEGECFHHDGQNFAKAYDIKFLDKDGKTKYAYQNTYAISTRMLGTMFAIHSDDKGLIIPPRAAERKLVIVPIFFDDSKDMVLKKAREIAKDFENIGAFVDERDNYKAGFKFNEWELKGVPLRIEIGPKDIEKNKVVLVRRDSLDKKDILIKDLKEIIPGILEDIQQGLYKKSEKLFKSKVSKADSIAELKKLVSEKKVGIIPLCNKEECEENLKSETGGAKAVFISEHDKIKNEKCIVCKNKADYFVYAGKTY
jgi:prolyl-tRNA synthetase